MGICIMSLKSREITLLLQESPVNICKINTFFIMA
jgi:hypothetical protein